MVTVETGKIISILEDEIRQLGNTEDSIDIEAFAKYLNKEFHDFIKDLKRA